jgi:hypothetical protein
MSDDQLMFKISLETFTKIPLLPNRQLVVVDFTHYGTKTEIRMHRKLHTLLFLLEILHRFPSSYN